MLNVLLAAFLGVGAPPIGDGFPARVRRVLGAERAGTSEIEWKLNWVGGYNDGLVERHVTRTCGDTVWESNLGDRRGYHAAGFTASVAGLSDDDKRRREVPKEQLSGTRNALTYEGWAIYLQKAEHPLSGYASLAQVAAMPLPVDLLSIGLAPRLDKQVRTNPFHLDADAYEGLEKATFQVGWESGFPTVSADWRDGACRLTWRFDDRRGGMPVQASFYHNDVRACFSETEYQRIGERWVPQLIQFYRGDPPVVYKTIEVQKATFDEPWHMSEISPSDIGLVSGTQLAGSEGDLAWTGADLIPLDDFWHLVYLDDSILDPRIAEMMVEGSGKMVEEYRARLRRTGQRWREEYRKTHGEDPALIDVRVGEKDEWDLYVEKFLAEHKPSEGGVEKAHEVRDRAKQLRDSRRRLHSADLRKARREGDQKTIERFEKVEKRIFERMLVRKLAVLARIWKDEEAKELAPAP